MPKRKRMAEEKFEYYKKKMNKYEKRQDFCQQTSVSPSGYTPHPEDYESEGQLEQDEIRIDMQSANESDDSEESDLSPATDPPAKQSSIADVHEQPPTEVQENSASSQPPPDTQETPVVTLDPELLQALGEATDATPDFGEKIHENLAQLWLPLLKKGLPKEGKEKLTKEYLIPENCKLLQAPKLNAEIKAAINDLGRNRDKKIAYTQQQLGSGITAINRAMTVLLTTDDKVKAIQCLSDSCRILCDLHYMQSQLRKKIITTSLDKSFCQVIQDVDRDETLFGEKLSENIKASKAIDRQSSQIKKPINNPKPSTSQSSTARSNSGSGNWTGHSRSSRGGRGGARRGGLTSHNTPRTLSGTAQTQLPSTNKPRAPQQQRR